MKSPRFTVDFVDAHGFHSSICLSEDAMIVLSVPSCSMFGLLITIYAQRGTSGSTLLVDG